MKNFRPINQNDKSDFIKFADEFYHSSAVDHTIPKSHHENTFCELMKSNTYALAYIIEYNQKSVGYALLSKTYSNEAGGIVIWIEELFILSEYRGLGLGKYALNCIGSLFNDVKRFRLEITPTNEKAKKLYQLEGFEILDYRQMFKDI